MERELVMTTIYYAHPMSWYGTKEEQKDLQAIWRKWPQATINNPAEMSEDFDNWRKNTGGYMDFFLAQIEMSDILVYRRFNDGTLGAGVAAEVAHAGLMEKPVYQVMDSGVSSKPLPTVEMALHSLLTVAQTREKVKN